MAKNRKNSAGGGVRFGPAVKAFFLCLVIGSLAVCYVWQKRQIYSLGVKTEQLEKRLAQLKRENEMRRQQMAMLQSLPYLDARVKELKLGLGVPTPDQILTLVEGQVVRTAPRQAPAPVLTAMAFPAEKTYLAYATKPLPPPARKR
jgi:cell division protein FtsL